MGEVAAKTRIMIIDDTADNLSLLNKLLTEQGYEIALFPKAELALRALALNIPDLILLDINMPGMNGFEFCAELKKNARYREIPIIFLSAMQDIADKLNAFRTGGVDYITKPFQFDEVLIRVKTHVKLRLQQKQLEENYRRLEEFEQSLEILVKKRTRELTLANRELKKSHAELHKLNEELERRVEQRTSELKIANRALENSLQQLQTDEEAGRLVQFRLLPPNRRIIADYRFEYGLRPSLYMTGDFVDYFDVDRDYAVFYIADVSGHGAASAFITFLLKSFINTCHDNYHTNHDATIIKPRELLAKFNKLLYEDNLDKYVTMFYGVLNKAGNTLTFANGGHFPFPFLCSNGSVQTLKEKSMPVGMFDFTQYQDVSLPLPDSFTFTVFSDGILEVIPEKNIRRQIARLEKLVNVENLDLAELVNGLTDNGQASLQDDITILALKKGKTT
ncbi:MAG: SpoIIE family protein phosphatase [Victivallaceae bacterium]|nr:SpoIIE family protein phosphatase [Victivallaceae bacterium]